MAASGGEVSLLLGELRRGRKSALDKLLPVVYQELRRVAGRYMRDERRATPFSPPRWSTRYSCGW